ncbi:target of EGR1 protein 1 [Brachyhypopomus gauderio]|uniref:target of EGR1 protein 1 n=1 Tax=Brachyhypopomus gauderio TaxID=698409 RepID=UPI004041C915
MSPTVVPVVDVQSNNLKELWPAMVLAFKTSCFIALDTELSGLGARKALLAESIEDRYKAICHAARTRSVLSLGIACYKRLDEKAERTYLVQVYNLTLLCAEEYIIEPQSVQFLVQHGFDFNKQYAQGVPYNKGNDKGGEVHGLNVRTLFVELLRAKKPLVVHNGLIDMAFLYQCFYAHLPEKLGTFTADLSEMFPAGIYDTKYTVEYELRFTASYLEYAYKKCKLDNARSIETGAEGPHLFLEFCHYSGHLQDYVDYRPCLESHSNDGGQNICVQFSAYGWCPSGSRCPMSHDTDLIIQQDERNKEDKRKKRKRRQKRKTTQDEVGGSPQDKRAHLDREEGDSVLGEETATSETSAAAIQHQQPGGNETEAPRPGDPGEAHGEENRGGASPAQVETADPGVDAQHASEKVLTTVKDGKVEGGTHRAGFDAFMTGYVFAFAGVLNQEPGTHTGLHGCQNKLYLSGKSVPLHVVKSTFSRSSKAHTRKMELVWGKRSSDNTSVRDDTV